MKKEQFGTLVLLFGILIRAVIRKGVYPTAELDSALVKIEKRVFKDMPWMKKE